MGFTSKQIGDTFIVSSDNSIRIVSANNIINGLEKIYNKKFYLFKGHGVMDLGDPDFPPLGVNLMYIAQAEIKEELIDEGDGGYMPAKYAIIGSTNTEIMFYKGEYYFKIQDYFGNHDDNNIQDNNVYKVVSEKAIDIDQNMFESYILEKR